MLGGLLRYSEMLPLLLAGFVVTGLFAVVAYAVNRDDPDRGITTELALVVTYALGALALDRPIVAPAAAVVMTWILALRGELHHLVKKTLTERELRDALIFLLIALVVLPIAPDQAMGPYGAVNPQSLVRLVLVLMAVTSTGYIARRAISPRLGLAVTGFVGGFISSSATIAAMSLRAKEAPTHWRAPAAAGLASSVATVAQYVIVIAAVDQTLLSALLPSLGLAAVAALLSAGALAWMSLREPGTPEKEGRPFQFWAALGFAGVFILVTIASSALQEYIGGAGIVLVSSVAAFVDAHSTAGSVASLHHAQVVDSDTARFAILASLTTNSITKVVLAWSGRHVQYGASITGGVLLIAACAWLGELF